MNRSFSCTVFLSLLVFFNVAAISIGVQGNPSVNGGFEDFEYLKKQNEEIRKQNRIDSKSGFKVINVHEVDYDDSDSSDSYDDSSYDDDDEFPQIQKLPELPEHKGSDVGRLGDPFVISPISGGKYVIMDQKKLVEIFPPSYYGSGHHHSTAKPWAIPTMITSARPLIVNRLIPRVSRMLPTLPPGWKRLMTLEDERPDGFPAMAFVYLGESSNWIVRAAANPGTTSGIIIKIGQGKKLPNEADALRNLEESLESYVLNQLKKDEYKLSSSVLTFGMKLRHDLFCTQLTSVFAPNNPSKETYFQKKTYLGRMYFAQLYPLEMPTDSPNNFSWDRYNTRNRYYGRYSWIQTDDTKKQNTRKVQKSRIFNSRNNTDFELESFLTLHSNTNVKVGSPLPVISLGMDGTIPLSVDYKMNPEDKKYLDQVWGEHDISSFHNIFSCPEDEVLSAPGVIDSCIYTRQYSPTKLELSHTSERIMMQCLGRYPQGSTIIYKQHTIIPKLKTKEGKILRQSYVEQQWKYRKCSQSGWETAAAIPPEQGPEKVFKACQYKQSSVANK